MAQSFVNLNLVDVQMLARHQLCDTANHSDLLQIGLSKVSEIFHLTDISALEKFILDQLSPISGIEKIRSSFALKQVRYKTALPMP